MTTGSPPVNLAWAGALVGVPETAPENTLSTAYGFVIAYRYDRLGLALDSH